MKQIFTKLLHVRTALMLLLTAVITMTTQTAWAWNGSGTQSSPYQITSTSDLIQLTNDVYNNGNTYSGKYFKLMNDLVFTTSNNWNGISPTFASIGNDTNPFEGTFDGDNHTLTGVYINRALNNNGDLYQGLFGVIGSGGVVKNIILNNSKIAASNYSGAIAGENRGTITNCHVTSSVIVSPQRDYINVGWESCYVGGIAGNNASGATISNCSSGAKIWTHEIQANSGSDASTSRYGGIAGVNAGSLTNCFALGVNIGIVQYSYGAITGYSNGTLANNYYADCFISVYSSNVGTTTSEGQVDVTTNDGAVRVRLITLSDFTTSSATVFTIPAHKELSGSSIVSVAAVNYNLAKVGTTITLGHTEHSIDSYFFRNYTVKDADDGNVTVNSNNTFTMPDKNVTATAVFKNFEWSGSGNSVNDPYFINSTEQLDLLAKRVKSGNTYANKYFKLGANITYNKATTNNFTPIGNSANSFKGIFDGNGKTISGINVNLSSTKNIGVFGFARNGAIIKNLKLDDSTIRGYYNVGAILGNGNDTNNANVENCLVTSSVTVKGTQVVGGIVGVYAIIRSCTSAANVSGDNNIGGIIGSGSESIVTNSLYTGNSVSGNSYFGAIAGKNSDGTLSNNYYTADLSCKGVNGSDTSGARKAVAINTASGVTLTPTGTATTYNVSGITAYADNNVIGYGGHFYAGATETVNLDIACNIEGFSITGYNDGSGNNLTNVSGTTYTLTMTADAPTVTPVGSDLWGVTTAGRDGSTADKAFRITTPEGLNLLAKKVNGIDGYEAKTYSGKFFELGDDITYNGSENNYTAIGTINHPFSGTFDGKGHTVSGIRIDKNENYQAIFGYITGATVKNLTVDDTRINIGSSTFTAGGILGLSEVDVIIENCHATSSVIISGAGTIGGIAGNSNGTIRGCTSAATVSGNTYIGGIAGKIDNSGSTTENNLVLGASVTGTQDVGAIVGYYDFGTLTNNRYTSATTVNGAAGSDQDGATVAYEFPDDIQDIIDALGTEGTTYGTGDYTGITAYQNGLKYNGKLYYTSLWTGNGYTARDPYVIYTPEGLDRLAELVNSDNTGVGNFYALGHDIAYDKTALTLDLDGQDGADSNFPGIGDYDKGNYFYGSLDGRGHTISGIVINRPSIDNVGLFAEISSGQSVENLTLANSDITGHDYVGAIAGYGGGRDRTIQNCHVASDVTVTGHDYLGGIVGGSACVLGSTSAANVTGHYTVGGVIGMGDYSTIRDCLYFGNSVTATSPSKYVGAIAGCGNNATVEDNYHTCSGMGGVGNSGDANGSDIDGAQFAVSSTNKPATFGDATATYGTGSYTGITAYGSNGLAYNGKYYYAGLWGGSGTVGDPYVIYNTEGLDLLAKKVNGTDGYEAKNYSGTYFKLGANIVYDENTENNFKTIGDGSHYFRGTFDGQGYTISGIWINKPNSYNIGIFGFVDSEEGTVKNLIVSNSRFVGNTDVGVIAAYLRSSTIENCHVGNDVTISGNFYVGGIACNNDNGNIKGCTCAATIIGTIDAGMNACYLGGVVGATSSSFSSSLLIDNIFTGAITGDLDKYIGAIVGKNKNGTLTNNYHTCSGMGGVGNEGDATNSDQDGAQFAVSSTSKPATFGDATATYGTGTYQGITAYGSNGLEYGGMYYWHVDNLMVIDNDGTENSSAIVDNQTRTVVLSGRTLYKDGGWNTICLPFSVDLDADGCPLAGAIARKLSEASINGSTLNLNFDNPVTTLDAGTPYIIMWEKADDYVDDDAHNIVAPVFTNVTVTTANNNFTTGSGDTKVQFIGTYDKVTFNDQNRSILFVGADNTLYYPDGSDVTTIGACRAYFKIGDGANARQITDFDFNFDGGETTAVFDLNNNEQIINNTEWYTLDGRKLDSKPTQKGVYINNGRKVVVK